MAQNEPASPVNIVDTGSEHDDPRRPQPGIALCLSGGGYRAMVFHLGALWRLNELGYLRKLDRVSSVSGGSITAGLLGLKWSRLEFDAAGVSPCSRGRSCGRSARWRARRSTGRDPGRHLPSRQHLGPRRRRVRQAPVPAARRCRTCRNGRGSSSTPPASRRVRCSVSRGPTWPTTAWGRSRTRASRWRSPWRRRRPSRPCSLPAASRWIRARGRRRRGQASEDLHREPFLSKAVLTDGGVYDNLGPRDGLEALSHDPREQRRRENAGGGGAPRGLGAPRHPRQRHHRQPGPQPAGAAGDRRPSRRETGRGVLGHPHLHRRLPARQRDACPEEKTIALANVATRLKRDGRRDPGAADQLGICRLRRGDAEARRAGRRPRRSAFPIRAAASDSRCSREPRQERMTCRPPQNRAG